MSLLSLLAATPAMAWDSFSVGLNFEPSRSHDRPTVVYERVHAPPVVVASTPVVVERPCPPVIVPRSHVKVVYVAPSRHRISHYVPYPHGVRVVVRGGHCR